ncbi:MAG: hypothetical protein GEV07_10855 [Streptosporangiales bacterium]|nr:hypothetical protein [Streptosporangiales bacterium]
MAAGSYRTTMENVRESKETTVYAHPDVLLAFARQHHDDLLAAAERGRLVALAKRHRKRLRRAAAEQAGGRRGEGTLPACGEHVPAPVR